MTGFRSLLVLGVTLAAASSAAPVSADSLDEIFARANTAYFNGEYDIAADGYRELIELGVLDADVAFNLATAEARQHHYGASIQYYEQSLWLRPGDDDSERGLEAARAAVGERRAEQHGEAEVDTGPELGEALFGGISRGGLAGATLVFDAVLFSAIIAFLFVKRESYRIAAGIIAPLSAVLFLVSGTGLAIRSGWFEQGAPAVVLREAAPLREGPQASADERHRTLEGQRAWILDSDIESEWTFVHVPNVGEGWIANADVGRVRPPTE